MKRKVNRVGANTLTVSLPNKWASKYGVRQGDELDVADKGASLVIETEAKPREEQKTIVYASQKSFVRRPIYIAYLQGYDVINIKFSERQVIRNIRSAVEMLMGFEIINEIENSCILKNIATAKESDYEAIKARLFYICKIMGVELLDALKEKDFEQLISIKQYEITANKLNLFCRRMLNLSPSIERARINSDYHTICVIEDTMDALRDICILLYDKKFIPSKKIFTLYRQYLFQYDLYLELKKSFSEIAIAKIKEGENTFSQTYIALNESANNMIIAGHINRAFYTLKGAIEETGY